LALDPLERRLPLRVDTAQEATLLARLEAARQVYNACLGESLRRREHLLYSTDYQTARAMKRGAERTKAFADAQKAAGFEEYALHDYAGQFGQEWLGQHLDSLTIQKLASRAFDAVEKYHYGQRGRPRFKSEGQLDSVEGKTNKSGIRCCTATVEQEVVKYVLWSKLRLDPIIDPHDKVVQHGLAAPVKYVRIVRRKVNGQNRFYVQLVCQGVPYRKEYHPLGEGKVGLDIGPSTIAIVSAIQAVLLLFCAQLERRDKVILRLQRQRDRQQRANNPDNYNPDGTIGKGKKTWKKSRRQAQTERKLAELQRQQAAYRQSLHGQLVHLILAHGNDIRMEKLSYRAFQKRFGRSVAFRAPGTFVNLLKRKVANTGAALTEFSTYHTKLSQTCHHCGKVVKKPLSQRWHRCDCGVEAQRDLYSAFLATCVDNNRLNADQAEEAWSGVDTLLRTALSDAQAQRASGGRPPASFGLNQRGVRRPAKFEGQVAKAIGAVGERATASAYAEREVVHPSEPSAFRHGE
jgi:transposase